MDSHGPHSVNFEDDPQASAFQRLFELHFAELYRFAYWYVRSAETAKDLVHDAFLCIWRRRAQVDLAGPSARSYLYTVARHKALDHLRRQRLEDRFRTTEHNDPPLSPPPDETFNAKEMVTTIRRALEALPRRERQVLTLRWQEQASYEQIGRALGISHKTVAVHAGRAIRRLRGILTDTR